MITSLSTAISFIALCISFITGLYGLIFLFISSLSEEDYDKLDAEIKFYYELVIFYFKKPK